MSKPALKHSGQESSLTTITDRGVSARTARRQRHYSFIPTTFKGYYGNIIPARTIGKDGKSYPHSRQSYKSNRVHSWILDALRYARHGLRKADTLACRDGVEPKDLAALETIGLQVTEILGRWRQTQEAGNDKQTRRLSGS
jgi:hypothetical protein